MEEIEKTFKKLFSIPFHGKTFTIFVDENHRYTFLENKEEGMYSYPTLEDFVLLNKIYNEHDPFVLYNTRYSFKEKVKIGVAFVAISVVLSGNEAQAKETIPLNWKIEKEQDNINLVSKELEAEKEIFSISGLDDLETYFSLEPVKYKDILEAINNNESLSKEWQERAQKLATTIYEKEPCADLRIFYLNLLTLKISEMSDEEYKEKFQNYSGACYDAQNNTIYCPFGSSEETLYHELSHTIFSFHRVINGKSYFHSSAPYFALNEAMNNKTVEMVMPTHSYQNICIVLDYLLTFTEYDFSRYNEEGARYIIQDLIPFCGVKEAYYINDCLNAMKDSSIELGKYVEVEECSDLLDTLFHLCKSKVDRNMENVYSPFLNFVELFPNNEELFYKYLEEYNIYLKECGIENRIKPESLAQNIALYKDVRGFTWNKDILFPYVDRTEHFVIVIENGKKKGIRNANCVFYPSGTFSLDLKKFFLQNPNEEISQDFWKKFVTENGYISPTEIYKTEVLLNGNSLTSDYLADLRVQIGLNSEDKIGYVVHDTDEKVIYQSSLHLRNLSQEVLLSSYVSSFFKDNSFNTLELLSVFNEEYLRKRVQEDSSLFENLFIEEEELRLEPYYFLYLKEENGGTYGIYLNQCVVYQSEDFSFQSHAIAMPLSYSVETSLYLKDILEYYHLLNENQNEYTFTRYEIEELVNTYLEERSHAQTK